MKMIYVACFYKKEDGRYTVVIPDLNGAATYGNDLAGAMEMASDLIGSWLLDAIESNEGIPKPTNIKDIVPDDDNGFTSLVSVDLTEYERIHSNKAVKKTLTIPAWLDTLAQKEGINFSKVLQEGLKKELNIDID